MLLRMVLLAPGIEVSIRIQLALTFKLVAHFHASKKNGLSLKATPMSKRFYLFYFSYKEIVKFLRSVIFTSLFKETDRKISSALSDFQPHFHKLLRQQIYHVFKRRQALSSSRFMLGLKPLPSSSALTNPTIPLVERKIHFAYMAAPIPENFFKNKR
jgi:hypothetical protein